MKVLVAGDSFMPTTYFREAFATLADRHTFEYLEIDSSRPFDPTSPSELKLREYQGSPAQLAERMSGVNVLAVHGAPVTDEVVEQGTSLQLVCCARGGPVNVDTDALSARGLPLVNTPGKNAEAVADLSIAFFVMLARGLPRAQRFVESGNRIKDNWEGAQFLGKDLRDQVLGLVGYGRIGTRVAARALGFGMKLLTYDPYVDVSDAHVEQVTSLEELLTRSDFVSLHARATDENENMLDANALAMMKRGSYLVNTARETLVDEEALNNALTSGRLAGVALDVIRTDNGESSALLLQHHNVVITPHVGGATRETLSRGAEMIALELARFAEGKPLLNVYNTLVVPA